MPLDFCLTLHSRDSSEPTIEYYCAHDGRELRVTSLVVRHGSAYTVSDVSEIDERRIGGWLCVHHGDEVRRRIAEREVCVGS